MSSEEREEIKDTTRKKITGKVTEIGEQKGRNTHPRDKRENERQIKSQYKNTRSSSHQINIFF